jgi:hypothetical protein
MFKSRAKGLRNIKSLVKCAWQQLRIKSKENLVTKEPFVCLLDML